MNNKNGSADFVTKVSRAIALYSGHSKYHLIANDPKQINLGSMLSNRYQTDFAKRKPVAAQRFFGITILFHMEDNWPVPAGSRGIVEHVDDAGQIHMIWDNGRTLAIVPQVDKFRRLTHQEIQIEQGSIIMEHMTSEMT